MNHSNNLNHFEETSSDGSNHSNGTNTGKCVLFVGNLSYFCEGHHLRELFEEYVQVQHARVMYNEQNTRSLMYGFVTLCSVQAAKEMERILDNHMFMGRPMRVASAQRKAQLNNPSSGNGSAKGCQVHVSFCSFFPEDAITQKPTEVFLRRAFMDFGKIVDVSVKDYQVYHEKNMQEGYGFVTFQSYECAMATCASAQNITLDGISMTCTLTHQHNPASKKHHNIPRQIPQPTQERLVPHQVSPPSTYAPLPVNGYIPMQTTSVTHPVNHPHSARMPSYPTHVVLANPAMHIPIQAAAPNWMPLSTQGPSHFVPMPHGMAPAMYSVPHQTGPMRSAAPILHTPPQTMVYPPHVANNSLSYYQQPAGTYVRSF